MDIHISNIPHRVLTGPTIKGEQNTLSNVNNQLNNKNIGAIIDVRPNLNPFNIKPEIIIYGVIVNIYNTTNYYGNIT